MQIWNYRHDTGEYVGPSVADADPLAEGVFLLPAFSTSLPPPTPDAGKVAVFINGAWAQEVDHRGEKWWDVDGNEKTIDKLGDPSALGLSNIEPPPPPGPRPVVSPRQIRLALNQMGLRDAVETYVAASDQNTKDSWTWSTQFERDHPLLLACAASLGKTEAEIDALFALASTL